jgi:NADH-quinone oxidoreductase subunit B/C/D
MAVNGDGNGRKKLPVVDEGPLAYEHPLYDTLLSVPGLSVATTSIDAILNWGLMNSLWIFPMATSCCGIELMAAAASRVDLDRMGTIVRATPRQAEIMVIAGTITTKMAPRVKLLWDQMPEPKWAIAMGSCAISGDFYRNLYPVVPGIDTVLPVDIYIPGCPPNPEALMHGLLRLKEKVALRRAGKLPPRDDRPDRLEVTKPSIARLLDPARDPAITAQQLESALHHTDDDRSDELPEGEERPFLEAPPALVAETPVEIDAMLRDEFGAVENAKEGAPVVPADKHLALAKKLRAMGYKIFVHVVATHFPEKTGKAPSPERFEVAYAVRSVGAGSKVVSWRLKLEPGQGAPSLVGVYAGADWQEREQWDLVGVRFDGHPDLRRIMLPENWDGHPLRKDYPADKACPPWR